MIDISIFDEIENKHDGLCYYDNRYKIFCDFYKDEIEKGIIKQIKSDNIYNNISTLIDTQHTYSCLIGGSFLLQQFYQEFDKLRKKPLHVIKNINSTPFKKCGDIDIFCRVDGGGSPLNKMKKNCYYEDKNSQYNFSKNNKNIFEEVKTLDSVTGRLYNFIFYTDTQYLQSFDFSFLYFFYDLKNNKLLYDNSVLWQLYKRQGFIKSPANTHEKRIEKYQDRGFEFLPKEKIMLEISKTMSSISKNNRKEK